ncbi:uncharacterized protein LOC113360367 [Papaver somniferum]|nr:uncharacterized protein LOC113360367 [Papaver somniferum]
MDTPKKIHQLEAGGGNQENEMPKLTLSETSSPDENDCGPKLGYSTQISDSNQVGRSRLASPTRKVDSWGCSGTVVCTASSREKNTADSPGRESVDLANIQSLNTLQSLGQSLHIFDRKGLVIYWNPMVEYLYGYSASEMLGRSPCWTGQFPVRNKQGRRFQVIATHTPLYDDYGTLVGIVCITCESQPFLEITSFSAPARSDLTTVNGVESQGKPWEVLTASEVLNLTSSKIKKIWTKSRTCDKIMKCELQGGNGPYVDHHSSIGSGCWSDNGERSLEEVSQGKQFGDEGESKFGICKLICCKAKEISWPWKRRAQN